MPMACTVCLILTASHTPGPTLQEKLEAANLAARTQVAMAAATMGPGDSAVVADPLEHEKPKDVSGSACFFAVLCGGA